MRKKWCNHEGESAFLMVKKSVMIWGCENIDNHGTPLASPAFVQAPRCKGFSVIRRPALCTCIGGGKNGLRSLRHDRARVVRSQAALGAGFGVWRLSNLFGDRGASNRLSRCLKVKQEKLEWLADNQFYSKRFAFFVGRRCRATTIKDVAQETHSDWKTIKELDKQYMGEQLRRIGTPTPKVIGVDEIAIRKGHTYRIVIMTFCAAARSGLGVRTVQNRDG